MGHTPRWDAGSAPGALCVQDGCKDGANKCMAAPGDLSRGKEAIPPRTPWEPGGPRGALPFHEPTFPLKAEGDRQGTATRHPPEPPTPIASASGWLARDPSFSHPSWSRLHRLSPQPRPREAPDWAHPKPGCPQLRCRRGWGRERREGPGGTGTPGAACRARSRRQSPLLLRAAPPAGCEPATAPGAASLGGACRGSPCTGWTPQLGGKLQEERAVANETPALRSAAGG